MVTIYDENVPTYENSLFQIKTFRVCSGGRQFVNDELNGSDTDSRRGQIKGDFTHPLYHKTSIIHYFKDIFFCHVAYL